MRLAHEDEARRLRAAVLRQRRDVYVGLEALVPAVKGACEIIAGGSAAEAAERLVARLRADGVLRA